MANVIKPSYQGPVKPGTSESFFRATGKSGGIPDESARSNRGGGGGGRRRKETIAQGTTAMMTVDPDLLARRESARQAEIEAGRQKQQLISSRRLGGQLSSPAQSRQDSSNITIEEPWQPTAREQLYSMSFPKPTTKFGGFIRGLETDSSFIQTKTEENLLSQRRGFEGKSESELISEAGKPGSRIIAMSTSKGSTFVFQFDEGAARRQAKQDFEALPIGQRRKLIVTGVAVGGARLITVDIPKYTPSMAIFERDSSTGKIERVSRGRSSFARELEARPTGASELIGRYAIPGAIGVKGLLSLPSAIKGMAGLTTSQKIAGIASSLSPIRPARATFFPRAGRQATDISEFPLRGGRRIQISKSSDGFTTTEQIVVTSRGRDFGKATIDFNTGKITAPRTRETIVSGIGVTKTPFAQMRGGRLVLGEQTRVYQIGGRISKQAIPFRPFVKGAGFGNPIRGRRFIGETKDLLQINKVDGQAVQVIKGTGSGTPVKTGLFGQRNIVTRGMDIGKTKLSLQTGQVFGARSPRISTGLSARQQLTEVDIVGRINRLTLKPSDTSSVGRTGSSFFRRGTRQIQRSSTTADIIPIVQPAQSVTKAGQITKITSSPSLQGTGSRTGIIPVSISRARHSSTTQIPSQRFFTKSTSITSSPMVLLSGNFQPLKEGTRQGMFSGVLSRQSFAQPQPQAQASFPILAQPQLQVPGLLTRQRGTPLFVSPSPRGLPPFRPFGFSPGSLDLGTRQGRGSSIFGGFNPRYNPSLTSSAFKITGKVPARFRGGVVDPFSRRVISGRRKTRRR